MVRYVFANAPATPVTLAGGGINSSATTIVVASGRGADLPAPGAGEAAILRIEDEYVTYTTRTTDTLTWVTRNFSVSTAASHAAGVEVRNVATKEVFDAIGGGSTTQGTFAARPAAGTTGNVYVARDVGIAYRDSGSAWVPSWVFNAADLPPDTPATEDDEFTAASLDAKWTWVNQGSATATLAGGRLKLLAPASASVDAKLIAQTAPSTPWTITTKCTLAALLTSPLNAGLVARESGTGKFETLMLIADPSNSNLPGLRIGRFTDATTYSANVLLTAITAATDLYLQVSDDGTNLIWRYSRDGSPGSFAEVYRSARTTHMAGGPNRVGLYANSHTTNKDTLLSVEWFRKTA